MEKKEVSKKTNVKAKDKKEEKDKKVKEVKEEKVEKVKEVKKEEIKKEPAEEVKKEAKKKEDNSKEMKEKIFKGIGVALVVALVLGFAYWVSLSYGENIEYEFTYIDVDQYIEYMNGDEAKIIYVARPLCSFCQQEEPIIKRVAAKNNLTLYYLDTTDFVEHNEDGTTKTDESGNVIYTENGKKFMASADVYKEGWGTPNTIIVKGGKIVDGIYQYVPEADLIELFKDNGFIK